MLNGVKTLLVASVAMALVGCGGNGSSIVNSPSKYGGNWSGNWTSTTLADGGVTTWTVAQDGSITGTMTLTSTGQTANCVGKVDSNGNFSVLAGFGAHGNYDCEGTFTLAAPNINVTYTTFWLGGQYQSNVTLKPVASGG